MNKRLVAVATATLATTYLNLPCLAQNSKLGTPAHPVTQAALGQFQIASSPHSGSVFMDVNHAQALPLLRTMVQQIQRKIILSDEATVTLQKTTIFTPHPTEINVDQFIREMAKANGLSWGKVGQDTYLVVLNNSPSKPDLPKTNEVPPASKTGPKSEPRQAPLDGYFWLLSPR
ncbi:MAG: hypothetical protein JO316_21225 [Abitibacteriaceae bacterium]|nr:hypothetical protein [Abditibacteriaceae bacterium]MBV9867884.1 hypothetical protein [Abditibacteriaceae bacterium]